MRSLRTPRTARPDRQGSALLMSFLVLILLAAIIFQLAIGTSTDARVARNDVALTQMDQAIESALIEVLDRLKIDLESSAATGTEGGAAGAPTTGLPALPEAAAGGGAAGAEAQPVDSREDSWGKPQRTAINEIELRILVQDEDSKLNVLQILTADEEEARKAFDRLVRLIDLFREGTTADVDLGDARRLAEAMREHLRTRDSSPLPRPQLLSDDPERVDLGMPLTLAEFAALEPFHEGLFRDFRDDRGRIVHSLGSFLTVWTCLGVDDTAAQAVAQANGTATTGSGTAAAPGTPGSSGQGGQTGQSGQSGQGNQQGQGGQGQQQGQQGQQGGQQGQQGAQGQQGGTGSQAGGTASKAGLSVNINTAPAAVLKALMDERDVSTRLWDEVIEYRNLEEKPAEGEETEPIYDEFGNEIIQRQVFDTLEELVQVAGWDRLTPIQQAEVQQLLDTQSRVFSVYISARRATGLEDSFGGVRGSRRSDEKEDQAGDAIVRTVRAVFWRRQDGDKIQLVPLVRWEVLDYTPFEVLDYPDEDR